MQNHISYIFLKRKNKTKNKTNKNKNTNEQQQQPQRRQQQKTTTTFNAKQLVWALGQSHEDRVRKEKEVVSHNILLFWTEIIVSLSVSYLSTGKMWRNVQRIVWSCLTEKCSVWMFCVCWCLFWTLTVSQSFSFLLYFQNKILYLRIVALVIGAFRRFELKSCCSFDQWQKTKNWISNQAYKVASKSNSAEVCRGLDLSVFALSEQSCIVLLRHKNRQVEISFYGTTSVQLWRKPVILLCLFWSVLGLKGFGRI